MAQAQFIDGIPVGIRSATFPELMDVIKEQNGRRRDYVANVRRLRSRDGQIVVGLDEPVMSESGVTSELSLRPHGAFDGQLFYELGIHSSYMKKLRAGAHVPAVAALADDTVNTWLDQLPPERKVMLRTFSGDDGHGIVRALLSGRYAAIDNFDLLVATMHGFKAAGMGSGDLQISGDVTDTRMFVRFTAPQIKALVAPIAEGYRYRGRDVTEFPFVFAGLELSNSETGGAAVSLTPRIEVQVCSNGQKVSNKAVRKFHMGHQLGEGSVNWSEGTANKVLAATASMVTDAVKTFMTPDFLEGVIAELAGAAQTPTVKETVEQVIRTNLSDAETEKVLDEWLMGGAQTAGGVLHAVTAFAQTVESADRASELEGMAIDLMQAVAAVPA